MEQECFEDELLRQGRLFTAPEELRKTCQLSAQLHCLLGWDLGFEDKGPEDVFGHSFKNDDIKGYLASRMWRLASKKMYDLREYGVKYTLYPRKPYRYWSPFTDDGGTLRVDWETLETIMFVLGSNIRYKKLANFPFFGLTLYGPFTGCWKDSYIPWVPESKQDGNGQAVRREDTNQVEPSDDLNHLDPYSVSGTWLRVISFLGEWICSIFSVIPTAVRFITLLLSMS